MPVVLTHLKIKIMFFLQKNYLFLKFRKYEYLWFLKAQYAKTKYKVFEFRIKIQDFPTWEVKLQQKHQMTRLLGEK